MTGRTRSGGRVRSLARSGSPAVLAGVGLALSIPPWGFWILAFPSAGLLWWCLHETRMRTRVWIGLMCGVGLYAPGLYWATTFNVYGGIVLIVAEAVAISVACGACGSGGGRLLALPGAMVLAEWVRDIWPFGGLPLGGVALGQASGPLADSARLGGPLLLTGLVWLAGAGLGSVATSFGRSASSGARTRRLTYGFAAIVAVAVVAVAGDLAANGGPALEKVDVALVQGGGARGLRKAEVSTASVFDAQVDASKRLDRAELDGGHGPGLVVWPEDVVSLPGPLGGSPEERTLAGIATRLRSTLLAGITETVSPEAFKNNVTAFSPSGSVVGTYEKVHRVPFGEYVPYRGFFEHLANLSAVPQDAVPGHGPGFIDTPSAPVGLMISFEVFFADAGRSATRAGAELLVVPTNTSSYSTSQVPTQEVAAARLQAIEEGRDLVQVAPTGYSVIVDNDGTVESRSVLGARQVLIGTVSLRDGSTVYERFGDVPVLVMAGIALGAGRAVEWRRRRSLSARSARSDRAG